MTASDLVECRDYRAPDAGGVLLTLAIAVPLLWRRQHLGTVLVVSGTARCWCKTPSAMALAWLACYWAVYSYAGSISACPAWTG